MAAKEKLQSAHEKLTDMFNDMLEHGVPIKDDETGKVHKGPMPAAYASILRQFLKDNNIEALAAPKSKMGNLVSNLPFAGESADQYGDSPLH